MNGNEGANFTYLNRDNRWLDFQWWGLELTPEGNLALASLPLFDGTLPAGLDQLPIPSAPAGIAVGPDRTIYFTNPDKNRVLSVNACDAALTPVACLGGAGDEPTRLQTPRGLLFHCKRNALFVADSGNNRIQIFEPLTFQWSKDHPLGLLDIWWHLDTPWTLAADEEGNVYVVEYGQQRVQKFDWRGNLIADFWTNVQQQHTALSQPSDVAVGANEPFAPYDAEGSANGVLDPEIKDRGTKGKVYILDADARTVFAFDLAGQNAHSFGSDHLVQPMGLATGGGMVYVGDNNLKRVLVFKADGTFMGEARGYEGPIAALALDGRGGLLVYTGDGLAPVLISLQGAYAKQGFLWAKNPFQNSSPRREQWHRLKARFAPLAADAHLQLFVYESAAGTPPPAFDPHASNPFAGWTAIALDSPECLIQGAPFDSVWVGVEFSGEGVSTPVLSQMRLDFDHQTYVQYLPALYQNDTPTRLFLTRFLSLFESLYNDAEACVNHLDALFDPQAVPTEFLSWLAGWLDLDLNEDWTAEQQRAAIAGAFELYAKRGTAEGLRLALRRFVGVEARIEEAILQAAWWSLAADETAAGLDAQNSILGYTTMLAPAEAQGAVVGTTAVLDHSNLITQDEFGVPLFQDVAHQFSVQLYRGASYSEQVVEQVRAWLDRERPAHTLYHLCVIEPRMRIGFQARLGIDTIVAASQPPTQLGETSAFGTNLRLGGEPPGRIGEQSRLGRTTRLGEGAL
jgi:phage tail-like protein